MPESESDFHWVIARNTCSVDRIFEKLRLDVKSDVEMRQKLRDPLPPPENGFHYGFSFSSNGSKFSASLKGRSLNHAIIFALTENYIIVSDENDKELFKASVTLSNDGQCRLVVGAVELEGWQFRKKALENFSFLPLRLQIGSQSLAVTNLNTTRRLVVTSVAGIVSQACVRSTGKRCH